MSSVSISADRPSSRRRRAARGPAMVASAARRVRSMKMTRMQRLRLLLLLATAFVASVIPFLLAASGALTMVGVAAGTTPQNVALVLVLGIAAPLASLRFSMLKLVGAGAAAGAALTILAEGGLDEGAMLSLAYPATALALSVLGTLAAHHVMIEFEHEHERMQCERFVPEQVVAQVLSRADANVGLGGIEVAGTIVFIDLRSFTSFSESRPAGQVIRVLNRYLGDISCAILAHGGTVVSYLGDGLMAVFGAPIEQPDHADRALAAAREILDVRLPRANAWMREERLGEGFRIGIGINSGSFIAGNVGNDRRLEYTAIGDAANTASRIEGLTKDAGRMLLMSRCTCDCLCDEAGELVYVGEFDVRGRHERVELWSLPGCGDDEAPVPVAAAAEASAA